jgi:cytochrome c-type biogenesis protein CcmE
MKKKKTFWVVAAVVFVLCVAVGLIFIFSKKNQEEFFEMQKASMPVLSFEMYGEKVNVLNGHRKEMNVVAMRDTIVVS